MNTKMKMRMLSLLLCFVMLVGLMPTTAFAWTAPTLSGNGGDAWNIQLSDEGVLTWNDMGSATYDIQVDETASGGTVTKIQGISGTSYNLINRFKELKIENGTYYFYIKANDTYTNSGHISFRYVSPEAKLSEPQNLRWDGTVAKWDSVANATEYEVKIYSNSGYRQQTITTTETQYDWTTEAAAGRWFEVVATGDNYRNSNAAEGPKYGSYSWSAPTLSGNGGDAWNIQLSDEGVLTWNDMGSATYDIQVDETASGGTVTKIQGISGTSYNLINRFKELKIENGTYYFYIKANDTYTNSGHISFRYVSPEAKLSEPQNLRWDGTVAKWDSVANATEYEVKIYSNSGWCQQTKTTTETQYDWTTEAAAGGWFAVIATAMDYRNSNAAESPKYGSSLLPITYTVTFDSNGGSAVTAQSIEAGQKGTKPADPTKANYAFAGWYSDSGLTQAFDFNTPISTDITLYAKWNEIINSVTATVTAPVGGEHPSFTVTVPDGAHYTAVVYAWYDLNNNGAHLTNSDTFVTGNEYQARIHFTANTGYEIANSASYTINGTPNYASFDTAQRGMIFVATAPAVTTYTVTYDANGGTGSMADATGVSGEYTLLANGFTAPDGKQFKAWSVGGVEKAVGSTINVTANTTVTAIWKELPTAEVTHSFGEYVYNNDATESADGTKTRTCSVCGHKETIVAEGTKLEKTLIDSSSKFIDVPSKAWYKKFVDYSVTYGIFTGTSSNTFSPNTDMTRAQFVQVFANISGVDTSNKNVNSGFSDVPKGKWYTAAVTWAAKNGIVSGVGDGKFDPDAKVTREQMCVMIVNYIENYQKRTLNVTANASTFADDKNISKWAKTAVYKCAKAGLVSGVGDGKFDPKASATRAQGATIFTNFFKEYMK